MRDITLHWYSDLEQLKTLYDDWQQLIQSQADNTGLFCGPDFIDAYWKQYQTDDAGVLVARNRASNQLLATCPIQIFNIEHKGKQYKCARPIGANFAPFIEWSIDAGARRTILNALLNQGFKSFLNLNCIFIGPLHERSLLYQTLLEDLGNTAILKTWRFPDNLHEIETRGRTLEEHHLLCSSKAFSAAQYAERRIARDLGPISWLQPVSSEEVCKAIKALCSLDMEYYGEDHAHRLHPEWPSFMAEFGANASRGADFDIQIMRINGIHALTSLGIRFKHRYYYIQSRSLPAYTPYSVDKIAQARLIEQCFKKQEIFCFGAGNYSYKRNWAPSVGELKCALIFFNKTTRVELDDILTPQAFSKFVAF